MAYINFTDRLSKEEFSTSIRQSFNEQFDEGSKTAVIDVDQLTDGFSDLCLLIQKETEARVRREMLQSSLN